MAEKIAFLQQLLEPLGFQVIVRDPISSALMVVDKQSGQSFFFDSVDAALEEFGDDQEVQQFLQGLETQQQELQGQTQPTGKPPWWNAQVEAIFGPWEQLGMEPVENPDTGLPTDEMRRNPRTFNTLFRAAENYADSLGFIQEPTEEQQTSRPGEIIPGEQFDPALAGQFFIRQPSGALQPVGTPQQERQPTLDEEIDRLILEGDIDKALELDAQRDRVLRERISPFQAASLAVQANPESRQEFAELMQTFLNPLGEEQAAPEAQPETEPAQRSREDVGRAFLEGGGRLTAQQAEGVFGQGPEGRRAPSRPQRRQTVEAGTGDVSRAQRTGSQRARTTPFDAQPEIEAGTGFASIPDPSRSTKQNIQAMTADVNPTDSVTQPGNQNANVPGGRRLADPFVDFFWDQLVQQRQREFTGRGLRTSRFR